MKTPFLLIQLRSFLFLLIIAAITFALWASTYNFQLIPSLYLTYLGQLTALLGIVYMGLTFILSARIIWLQRLLTGLDKIYRIHVATGILAYVFILAHPILLGLRGNFFRYFLILPDNSLARNLGILAFYLLTVIMFSAAARKVKYELWKRIHNLFGGVLLIGGAHAILASATMSRSSLLMAWVMLFVIAGVIAYIYKTFLYDKIGPVYKYVVDKVEITEELTNIKLRPLGRKMPYMAGQFSFISVLNNPKIKSEQHPYTMSSAPQENGDIEFSIKKLGDWSDSFVNIQKGDKVNLFGPYGTFTKIHLKECTKQIWIGGGIGITPFLSMIQAEAMTPSCDNIYLIYSDNNAKQAVFTSMIDKLEKEAPHLKTIFHLSDSQGYLNTKEIAEWCNGIQNTIFLLCGPEAMTESLKSQLLKEGVNSEDIVFEYFNFK